MRTAACPPPVRAAQVPSPISTNGRTRSPVLIFVSFLAAIVACGRREHPSIAAHRFRRGSQNRAEKTQQRDGHHASSHQGAERKSSICPGLPEAQQVAAKYALSTSRNGDAVQAMCVLHRGTFVGTTPTGASVSSQRVFGYGEIEKLLAHAQFLVTHDKANAKLTDSDARSYLALQSCGTTHLETCLKTHAQPGHSGSKKGGNGHGYK